MLIKKKIGKFFLPVAVLISTIIISCSETGSPLLRPENIKNSTTNKNTFLSKPEIAELEKEYGRFGTKTFSTGYLEKKLNKWKAEGNDSRLIREIEFARLKHPQLYCSVISGEGNSLQTYINGKIPSLMAQNNQPSFTNFLNYGCGIVTPGLVLNLDAGNTASYPSPFTGSIWTDLSGNGNNATLKSSPSFNPANQGSLSFDGSTNWALIPNSASLNTVPVSVSIWLKTSSLPADKVILSKGNGSTRTYWIYEDNGISFWYLNTFTNKIPANSVTDGKWHNITGTYDGSSLIAIYFDGTLFDSQPCTSTFTNSDGIGINAYPNGSYIAAPKNISNIQIYNRPLSANEVLQNYNSLKTRFGL